MDLKRFVAVAGLFAVLAGLGDAASANAGRWRAFPIADAWSGTDVKFGVAADEQTAYVAYYDTARALTLARVTLASGEVERATLGRVFGGYNSHNELVLHRSKAGELHLSGDMHATPLVYGSMRFGAPPAEFKLTNRMTGVAEGEVTYPRFYDRADGSLAFVYRDGRSGRAATRVKIKDGGGWRDTPAPLFDGSETTPRSSAYFGDIVQGPDGVFHLGWNWRFSSDGATNSDISYARSVDLERWSTLSGEALETPIQVGSKATAVRIAPRKGLQNPPAVSIDRTGRPLMAFVTNDAGDRAQVYIARPDERSSWVARAVTKWRDVVDVSGHGTRAKMIRYRPILPSADGGYVLQLYNAATGACQLRLSATLEPSGCGAKGVGPERPPTPEALRKLPAGYSLMRLPAPRAEAAAAAPEAWLVWAAQQAPGDRRPACSPDRPVACEPPPMPLTLYARGAGGG